VDAPAIPLLRLICALDGRPLMSRILSGVRFLVRTRTGTMESAEYSASPRGPRSNGSSPGRRWCVAAASTLCYACLPKRTTSTRSQQSHPSPRARAGLLSLTQLAPSWCCDPPFPQIAETAKSAAPDQERSSSCFPHSVNRRASACGPGRRPAPQPPPPPGGCEGVAVPEGAGGRSTPGYPQPFQSRGHEAPRLTTIFPRVFHRARFPPAPQRSRLGACPAAARAPGWWREPTSNASVVHRREARVPRPRS
jgi:hypothetical protein